jgi:histidine ammonia-lyase
VRTLQRDAADPISTVSAAVRARDRDHVSRQWSRARKAGRILKKFESVEAIGYQV